MERWERRCTKHNSDVHFMLADWKGSYACFPWPQLGDDMEAARLSGKTVRLYDMAGQLKLNGYPNGTWYMNRKVYTTVVAALSIL